MDFAAFIKSIERRLIGYLRFATLSAAKAEVLFDQTCTDLRLRWASIPDDERETAAFEAASATVERFNTECASTLEPDDDELSRELAALTAKAREALCMNTFGPKPRESELGARLLNKMPAPSLPRQMRVTRTVFRSLAAVALSLCVCLALVSGFAALQGGAQTGAKASETPEDWLGDEIAEVLRRETESTFYKGALAEPALGEELLATGPVVEFDVLVPKALPQGFRLEAVRHFKREETGVDFDILRLTYAKGDARLILLEAESGFPWRSEFNVKVSRNARSVQRYGTAVLAISNVFSEDALDEITSQLAPRK